VTRTGNSVVECALGGEVDGDAVAQPLGCAGRATTGMEVVARLGPGYAASAGSADVADAPAVWVQLVCSGEC
jgi:hypothetical protein